MMCTLNRSLAACFFLLLPALSHAEKIPGNKTWKPIPFAIVKFNEEAPKSWNLYFGDKKGLLLARVWKRYLLVDLNEQQAFDIDPQQISGEGDNIRWSPASSPGTPLETSEWKARNVGPVYRVRFRLSKEGHFLELQIPRRPDGKPAY
jgi:hypothetical protein